MSLFSPLAQINYSYNTSPSTNRGVAGLIIGLGVVIGIIGIVGLWKVFMKAGRPGWAAIIPVYNVWVLFEVAGKPGWWSLVSLLVVIPVLGIVAYIVMLVLVIMAAIELSRRFGKSGAFTILLVLFPYIGYLILGFGSATYNPHATPIAGPGTGPMPPTPVV